MKSKRNGVMAQTIEQAVKATSLFGFSSSTWETIIIAIASALIGGALTHMSKVWLDTRQARTKVVGLMTEKRIEAYKEIIEALDLWGSVFYNANQKRIELIKELTDGTYITHMPMYSVILRNTKSLQDFNALWQSTVQGTHLYVDSKITKMCRMVSWYLKELYDTFYLDFYELRENQAKQEKAIEKTMEEIGCIVFDDYHIVADPIYKAVVDYYKKPRLTIQKESLRNIQEAELRDFIDLIPSTNLYKYNLVIRRRILENLGYTTESADDILKRMIYKITLSLVHKIEGLQAVYFLNGFGKVYMI